jgi:hypothetical protein
MDLANKYFMRSCGESRFQANGFREKVVMSLIDDLKGIVVFNEGISTLVKENKQLEKLNALMEDIHSVVDEDKHVYDNYIAVIDYLTAHVVFAPIFSVVDVSQVLLLTRKMIWTLDRASRKIEPPVSQKGCWVCDLKANLFS